MSIVSRSKSYLDNEKAFIAWLEAGSTRKALRHLEVEGIVNPETGKPFSSFALWYSSWCYVLENPIKTKPLFERERRKTYEEHEWEEFLVGKAIAIYLRRSSKGRFLDWIERKNFEEYEYVYAEEFPSDTTEKVQS